jgi:hypothetical protein
VSYLLTINIFINPEMGDLGPQWPAPSLKKKKKKKKKKRRRKEGGGEGEEGGEA